MDKSFLQSHTWQNFQESLGRKTFCVNNQLVIKHSLPLGLNFLYAPRPSFSNKKSFDDFVDEAYRLAKKENAVFLRIEPDLAKNFDIEELIISQGFFTGKFKIVKNIQPADTLILDLAKSENDLLADMHSKTRYNIRLAEKHGVKIKKTVNPQDVDVFWQLALETSKRDKFRYHPKNYYRKMLETFGAKGTLKLFIAYSQDRPIAAAFFIFSGDEAIYLHGASSHHDRQLMAPYMLQWEAIREAKKRGCTEYDFWGIQPQVVTKELKNIEIPMVSPKTNQSRILDRTKSVGTKEHRDKFLSFSVPQFESARSKWASWAGITRFKIGFAPRSKPTHYPPTVELVLRPVWYKLYNLAKSLVS